MVTQAIAWSVAFLPPSLANAGVASFPVAPPRSIERALVAKFPRLRSVKWPPGGRTRVQAARGDCPARQPSLQPLLREEVTETGQRSVSGRSLSDRPRIWVYVPYLQSDGVSAEVTLRDSEGMLIPDSQHVVALPSQPGILAIDLPKAITLKANIWYRWTFAVKCDPIAYIWGWIQYAPDNDLSHFIQTRPLNERDRLYLDYGYWLDAVNTLAETAQTPTERPRWERFLQQQGFAELLLEPIAN